MGIDTLEPDPRKSRSRLAEKDFIQESYSERPQLLWMMVAAFLSVVLLAWGISSWYGEMMKVQVEKSPFLQVTNREMSLFLWQFPEYMPQHVEEKTGYLPAFNFRDKLGVTIAEADKFVQAPPELLFMYHTWARLLKDEYIPRPISRGDFVKFLQQQPEWKPENWKEAPRSYGIWVKNIANFEGDDLDNLPSEAFPIEVRKAFQGWKNYTMEGEYVNLIRINFSDIDKFLTLFPHYKRNYWQNIVHNRYPRYLLSTTFGGYNPSSEVPKGEIAPFLRVALFNYIQSEKGF